MWQLRFGHTEQKVVGQIPLHRGNLSRRPLHRRPRRHLDLGQVLQYVADFQRFHRLHLALVDGTVEVHHLLEQILAEATFLAPFVLGVRRCEDCEREGGLLGGWLLLLRGSFRRFLAQKGGASGLLQQGLLGGDFRRLLFAGEGRSRGGIVGEILQGKFGGGAELAFAGQGRF